MDRIELTIFIVLQFLMIFKIFCIRCQFLKFFAWQILFMVST